jgi:PIN domain nuclease of toxin-antitoxin system
MVREQFEANRILELSIKLPHILALNRLPDIHHAPFDHLLVAQAETEDAVIITNDNRIIQYPIATVW